MQQIKEEIYNMIKTFLKPDIDIYDNLDSDLMEDLDFDSIQILELIGLIEETYHIEFTDYSELLDRIESVCGFAEYVGELIEHANS